MQAVKAIRFGTIVQTARNLAYSLDEYARSRYLPAYNSTANATAICPLSTKARQLVKRGGTYGKEISMDEGCCDKRPRE